MQRFFVNIENISAGEVVITDSRVHQIRDVLRMKVGDQIIVLDNTGVEYHVRLTNISQKEVTGEILQKTECEAEPHTKITIYQSLLARDKFGVVLQKCTEVGVTCFVPVVTERSIVRKPGKITKEKLKRFESIISEAAEQSERGIVPLIKSPVVMNQVLSELDNYDICLVGSTQESPSLKEILRSNESSYKTIALFIGPEGGFSDNELEELFSHGAKPFSLGRRILRTETTGVVAAGIILYELEQ